MKGRAIEWSDAELSWIEARKGMVRRDLHAAFVAAFGRADVSLSNLNALCKRKGWLTGRTGRYEKGRTPENKGKSMPYNPNSARTQFKKGREPHNTRYLGHERIGTDGYVQISIAETNPHTGYGRRYVLKHRWLWEKVNGPLPDGMCLKCLDGDKTNCDPDNWRAIPRALLPRLSGGRWHKPYDDYEPEVRPAVLAIAELEHKARERRS